MRRVVRKVPVVIHPGRVLAGAYAQKVDTLSLLITDHALSLLITDQALTIILYISCASMNSGAIADCHLYSRHNKLYTYYPVPAQRTALRQEGQQHTENVKLFRNIYQNQFVHRACLSIFLILPWCERNDRWRLVLEVDAECRHNGFAIWFRRRWKRGYRILDNDGGRGPSSCMRFCDIIYVITIIDIAVQWWIVWCSKKRRVVQVYLFCW